MEGGGGLGLSNCPLNPAIGLLIDDDDVLVM